MGFHFQKPKSFWKIGNDRKHIIMLLEKLPKIKELRNNKLVQVKILKQLQNVSFLIFLGFSN
jgi:hypothetical protein